MEIENSDHFRSIKDKLLGMPFLMYRLRQHPEPYRGTWQYELYEKLFGVEYDYRRWDHESEEKINKFNYSQFLHPSVIKKFDVQSEEFEMYIRKLNYETKTELEKYREIEFGYNPIIKENILMDTIESKSGDLVIINPNYLCCCISTPLSICNN